ncbi:hypothetical protein GC174_04005 [bacterium]|nr:hypothetical protein [bacterium]
MACAQSIIPPADDAVGGGNPLQGLGRPDDPGPSRVEDYLNSLKSTILDTEDGGAKPIDAQSDQQSGAASDTNNTTDSALPTTEGEQKPDTLPPIPADDDQTKKYAESNLLPPPPPTESTTERTAEKADTPHRRALTMIQKRNYQEAVVLLNREKDLAPGDLKLRYLLAVAYVLQGKESLASTEYRYIITNSRDERLKELARTGLAKLHPQ